MKFSLPGLVPLCLCESFMMLSSAIGKERREGGKEREGRKKVTELTCIIRTFFPCQILTCTKVGPLQDGWIQTDSLPLHSANFRLSAPLMVSRELLEFQLSHVDRASKRREIVSSLPLCKRGIGSNKINFILFFQKHTCRLPCISHHLCLHITGEKNVTDPQEEQRQLTFTSAIGNRSA